MKNYPTDFRSETCFGISESSAFRWHPFLARNSNFKIQPSDWSEIFEIFLANFFLFNILGIMAILIFLDFDRLPWNSTTWTTLLWNLLSDRNPWHSSQVKVSHPRIVARWLALAPSYAFLYVTWSRTWLAAQSRIYRQEFDRSIPFFNF